MVNGWWLRSCSFKTGITLPLEPSTFPNLTETHLIPLAGREERINSQIRFVAPMTLVGLTALSEGNEHKVFAPNLFG